MFWPFLRRCHILRWDWSVLPLAHHSIFPFENFGACWFLYVSTILWLTHRDCRIYSACLMSQVLNAYTYWTSVYHLIQRTWESPAPSNSNPEPLALESDALTTAPLALSGDQILSQCWCVLWMLKRGRISFPFISSLFHTLATHNPTIRKKKNTHFVEQRIPFSTLHVHYGEKTNIHAKHYSHGYNEDADILNSKSQIYNKHTI
jgi:hypothetical protein